MRPRSRLLTKKRVLLPTICEGTEETARDCNDANTTQFGNKDQGLSSDDYLLSICHLAGPTFPAREGSPKNIHVRQQDTVQRRLRPSRFITLTTSDVNHKEDEDDGKGLGKRLNGQRLMRCNSDPLELLYGEESDLFALSGSVEKAFVGARLSSQQGLNACACASSPNFLCHCKNSSPGLIAETNLLVPNVSLKRSPARSEVRRVCQVGESPSPAVRQSFISHWISDCRSAWREARLRACMLPAIAEV